MTSRPDGQPARDERRWVNPTYLCVEKPYEGAVQVIPLAAHEAALAAARQVDDAMAKRAWDAWFAACEEHGADLDGMRAALLAALNAPDDCPGCGAPRGMPPAGPCEAHGTPEAVALNAPDPASEKPPRNPQHLEAEREDPSVVDALVRVTGQLAALREAAQTLLDVAAVVGAGPREFAALRAAMNPEPEGER